MEFHKTTNSPFRNAPMLWCLKNHTRSRTRILHFFGWFGAKDPRPLSFPCRSSGGGAKAKLPWPTCLLQLLSQPTPRKPNFCQKWSFFDEFGECWETFPHESKLISCVFVVKDITFAYFCYYNEDGFDWLCIRHPPTNKHETTWNNTQWHNALGTGAQRSRDFGELARCPDFVGNFVKHSERSSANTRNHSYTCISIRFN